MTQIGGYLLNSSNTIDERTSAGMRILSAAILSDDGNLCGLLQHMLAVSQSPAFSTAIIAPQNFSPAALSGIDLIFLDCTYRSYSYLETLREYRKPIKPITGTAVSNTAKTVLVIDELNISDEMATFAQAVKEGIDHFVLKTDLSLKRILAALAQPQFPLEHSRSSSTPAEDQQASSLYNDLQKTKTQMPADQHERLTRRATTDKIDQRRIEHVLTADIENQRVHIDAVIQSPLYAEEEGLITLQEWLNKLEASSRKEFESLILAACDYKMLPEQIGLQLSPSDNSIYSAQLSDIQIKNNGQGRVVGISAKLEIFPLTQDSDNDIFKPHTGFDNLGDSKDLLVNDKAWENIARSLPMMCLLLDEQGYVVQLVDNDSRNHDNFPNIETGKQLTELLDIESLDGIADAINRTLNTGKEHQQTIAYNSKQGIRWLDTYITKLRGNSGLSRQVVWTAFDITATRHSYQELLKNHDALVHILDDAPLLFFQKDNSGRFQRANKAFCELFSLREDVISGRNDQEVFRDAADNFSGISIQALSENESSFHSDYEETIDGTAYIFHWRVLLQKRLGTSQIDSFFGFGFATLATEKTTLEGHSERLKTTQKISSIPEKRTLELTGAISQDFKSILHSVVNYTELALSQNNKNRTQRVSDYLADLEKTVKHARDLVFDKQGNDSTESITHLDLKPLVQEIVDMVAPTLPTSLNFRTNLQSIQGKALAEESIFKKIVMLLLINARTTAHAASQHPTSKNSDQDILLSLTNVDIAQNHCTACETPLTGNYVALTVETKTGELDADEQAKLVAAAQSATQSNTDNNVVALAHSINGHVTISFSNHTLSLQLLFQKA